MSATQTVAEIELGPVVPIEGLNWKRGDDSSKKATTDAATIGTNSATPADRASSSEPAPPSKLHASGVMTTVACVSLLNTFNSGMLTVALPTIAQDLGIPDNLLLWPASIYALGLSCTLLLLGAITDLVGSRPVFLTGSLLYTAFTLAVSLARTGEQLIAFRTLQGIAMSFCIPPAVSTITSTFPSGRLRNIAFAVFGGGSPIGFALGLVLGGVFVRVSNWRTGYYVSTSIGAASLVLAWFALPGKGVPGPSVRELRRKLVHEFDWVGVGSASTCLALLSYIFAEITYSGSVMKKPHAIVLLTIAALLIPFFVFWEGRQERQGAPVILPNSIWCRIEFTAVCLTVFLVWCWFNAFGYWSTLYFQVTQELDALQAALRFLPLVIVGVATNMVAGLIMDRVGAGPLALVGGIISTLAPLLFALQDPGWSYWVSAFPAMCLSVVNTDLLFNISNLVITTNFPAKNQALAGGVFNTVTQLGNSIGLAVTAMIAASVTDSAGHGKKIMSEGMSYDYGTLRGYRSAFWACFAAAVVSTVISAVGLWKAGKVGEKKDI